MNPIILIKGILGISAGIYSLYISDYKVGAIYILVGCIDFIMCTVKA